MSTSNQSGNSIGLFDSRNIVTYRKAVADRVRRVVQTPATLRRGFVFVGLHHGEVSASAFRVNDSDILTHYGTDHKTATIIARRFITYACKHNFVIRLTLLTLALTLLPACGRDRISYIVGPASATLGATVWTPSVAVTIEDGGMVFFAPGQYEGTTMPTTPKEANNAD